MIRSVLATVARAEIVAVSVPSAPAARRLTIRSHRPGVGGSMLSVRQRAGSSTRTCSGRRSREITAVCGW